MSNAEEYIATAASNPPPSQPSESPTILDVAAPEDAVDDASPQPANAAAGPATLTPTNANSESLIATVSTSTSSQPPVENGDNAASTYGTRSRNRTGGRPNYAEDRELDLEIEALSKPVGSRASKRAATSIEQAPALATVNGALPQDKSVENASASTPAQAAAPAAPSKKRKQIGSNITVSANTTATTSRSRPISSVPFKGYVETNMMSFTRGGYRLNAKKQLVADDGTTVQANGNLAPFNCNVAKMY